VTGAGGDILLVEATRSASVTMTTALVSRLTGKRVRSSVGMTGEVTLHGRVLPIGGVKQKVLAAHRASLTEIILPAQNKADIDDVREVLSIALEDHQTTGETPDQDLRRQPKAAAG